MRKPEFEMQTHIDSNFFNGDCSNPNKRHEGFNGYTKMAPGQAKSLSGRFGRGTMENAAYLSRGRLGVM